MDKLSLILLILGIILFFGGVVLFIALGNGIFIALTVVGMLMLIASIICHFGVIGMRTDNFFNSKSRRYQSENVKLEKKEENQNTRKV